MIKSDLWLLANYLPLPPRPRSFVQGEVFLLDHRCDGDGDDGEDDTEDDVDVDVTEVGLTTQVGNLSVETGLSAEQAAAAQAAAQGHASVSVGIDSVTAMGNTTVTNQTDTSFSFSGQVAISVSGNVVGIATSAPGQTGSVTAVTGGISIH